MTRESDNDEHSIGPEPSSDQISDHGIMHIVDETVVWCNDTVTDFIAIHPEDIIGRACHDVICHRDDPCELCSSAKVEQNEGPSVTRIMNDTGVLDTIYCYPLGSRDGPNDIMSIIQRHSLDKVVSQTPVATTPRYRSLVETVPDLVGIIDEKATLLFTQRVSESPSYRNLIGKSVLDVFTPIDTAAFMEMVHHVFETGEHVSRDIHAVGDQDHDYHINVSIWPITDGDSIEQAYIVVRDVSWEDEALSALLEVEERFRFIFNGTGIGLVLTDDEGRILEVNHTFSRMLDYPKEEMVSKPFTDLFEVSDSGKEDGIFGELVQNGGIRFPLEKKLMKKDGGVVWVNMEFSLQTNLTQGSDSVLIVVDDITQRIELEHAVKYHLEFERLLIDFSMDLFDVPTDDADGRIDNVLEDLSKFLYADGAFLFVSTEDYQQVSLTNSWKSGKVTSDIDGNNEVDSIGTWEHFEEIIGEVVGDEGCRECDFSTDCDRVVTHTVDGLGSFLIVEMLSMKNLRRYLIVHSANPDRAWSGHEHDILQYTGRNLALVLHRVNLKEERESFFNHTSDLLGIYNRGEGVFTRINPAFEKFIGIHQGEGGSAKLKDLVHPNDIKRLEHHLHGTMDVAEPRTVQVRFISINGEIKWAELRFSTSLGGSEVYTVGRDITKQKRTTLEVTRRQLDLKIEEGHVYLELGKGPEMMLRVISTLVEIGYYGVILSRSPQLHIPGVDDNNLCQYWLAENEDPRAIHPDIGSIRDVCSGLPQRSVLLVDRLDYLLLKKDFDHVLEIVHYLNELAYLRQDIILISLDPHTFTDQQLRVIEKECSKIEPEHNDSLPNELMDIIRIAKIKTRSRLDFGYADIMRELSISKPTARKRISSLIHQDYIEETGSGRRKQFSVTEKGRKLFKERFF